MTEETQKKIEESISSSDVLTTIYDVNRAIFRHLPIYSIDSCSLVCQAWAQLARLVKTQRHTVHALTYPPNPLSSTIEFPYLRSDFDRFLSSVIQNNLWSIPYLAFIVVTNNLEKKGFQSLTSATGDASSSPKHPKRFRSQSASNRTQRCDILQSCLHHLNKSCQVLMVVSDAIVASNEDNQTNEIEQDDALGILLLPRFPSNTLGVYPFEISNKTPISSTMSRADLHQCLGGIPDNIPIRSVIFFSSSPQYQTVNCMKKLLEFYSPDIAIIGGYVSRSRYDNRKDTRKHSSTNPCGIVLTGDRNHLHIRQIVLKNQIQTREAIREKLKELKSNEYQQRSLSFAIQVSCVARGLDFYNQESNVECSEFRTLFPNTPLIGIFGNGEFGHDYLADEQSKTQTLKDLFHSYSTIFSLVSIRL
ncbi:unnamed protein product [Adineta ricciae]|uniref:FIST C-domain domain-containing protein n=1 Tax=Adineta ricciae TaxID=249248 RepID=A0A815JRQ2_ADIRI|nr:unnamed protein product [Adineta ricciae]CAF1385737.1 unnamed protein product [Adineta ricciae]